MRLAGLAGQGYESKGQLRFEHKDGRCNEMPAARHRAYSGDVLVIHVRPRQDSGCRNTQAPMGKLSTIE
jgi:hypothetical protein